MTFKMIDGEKWPSRAKSQSLGRRSPNKERGSKPGSRRRGKGVDLRIRKLRFDKSVLN
jgi:hypothetical protein